VVTEHFAKSDTTVLSRSLKVDIDLGRHRPCVSTQNTQVLINVQQ